MELRCFTRCNGITPPTWLYWVSPSIRYQLIESSSTSVHWLLLRCSNDFHFERRNNNLISIWSLIEWMGYWARIIGPDEIASYALEILITATHGSVTMAMTSESMWSLWSFETMLQPLHHQPQWIMMEKRSHSLHRHIILASIQFFIVTTTETGHSHATLRFIRSKWPFDSLDSSIRRQLA